MSKKIEAHEYQLLKIFSSDFDYHIPPYQRPYAWTIDEASMLFDDLFDFFQNEEEENYFLGSIVLIKEDNKPRSDVIDGQQRLTTLSVLISCIASQMNEEDRGDLKKYLVEPGDKFAGLSSSPRLTLRSKDNDFFEKHIQEIHVDELIELDFGKLSEPKQHIVENAQIFLKKIKINLDKNKLEEFSKFLLQRCYLVVVATSSEKSAFRIFSVMNSRGLPLLATDIIKSEIIGKISENEQDKYTNIWEGMEEQLGRDDFNNLFAHTRMIFSKVKAKKNLLDEFRTSVMSSFSNNPKDLIDSILIPYTESYFEIKHSQYDSTNNATEINNMLKWLNKIDNSDWISPAILFFSENRNSSDMTLRFIEKLERLAAYMHITSKDINFRIGRYAEVIKQIQSKTKPITALELTEQEKEDFKSKLNGDIYKMVPKRRNYFILRLDSFVSDGAAQYSPRVLTIEHVLPQTIKPNSKWQNDWFSELNEEEQEILHRDWIHKIANLVPLTRQKNSEAQNFDFDEKKEKYFMGKSGTSSYALTTQVLNTKYWDLEVVKERQKYIMAIFEKKWNLAYNSMSNIPETNTETIIKKDGKFKADYKIMMPAKIYNQLSENTEKVMVSFNGDEPVEVNVIWNGQQLSNVTEYFEKYNLGKPSNSEGPKNVRAIWNWDDENAIISIQLKEN